MRQFNLPIGGILKTFVIVAFTFLAGYLISHSKAIPPLDLFIDTTYNNLWIKFCGIPVDNLKKIQIPEKRN